MESPGLLGPHLAVLTRAGLGGSRGLGPGLSGLYHPHSSDCLTPVSLYLPAWCHRRLGLQPGNDRVHTGLPFTGTSGGLKSSWGPRRAPWCIYPSEGDPFSSPTKTCGLEVAIPADSPWHCLSSPAATVDSVAHENEGPQPRARG